MRRVSITRVNRLEFNTLLAEPICHGVCMHPQADVGIDTSGVDNHHDRIRPSGVRLLKYQEPAESLGLFFWGVYMRVRRIAVLIDGGFFVERLPKLAGSEFCTTPTQVADTARHLCKRHVQREIGQ
jgi:hypothetical protein